MCWNVVSRWDVVGSWNVVGNPRLACWESATKVRGGGAIIE